MNWKSNLKENYKFKKGDCVQNKKIKVLAIVGATASGKTALGVELAKKFDGEVISADSMQIYQGLDITTAKPTQEEMQNIKHHLIGFQPRTENFSVADYVNLANEKIQEVVSRGKLPILVGGTGLYIDSVLKGMQFSPEGDSQIRQKLIQRVEAEGIENLYQELQALDLEASQKIHPNNHVRVIRALEICLATGKSFTEYKAKNNSHESPYDVFWLGLDYANRQDLYDKINQRVYQMLEQGMLEEVQQAYQQGTVGTASMAIGYKELILYLEKKASLQECIALIQQETRRYAKRQLTWFRRNAQIQWLILSKNDELQKISEKAQKMIAKNENMWYNV